MNVFDLLCCIEESSVRCLEFTFLELTATITETFRSWIYTGVQTALFLASTKPKWVYSIWAWEEICCLWISLYILPSRVGPSAWHELQIFFWDSNWFFTNTWVIIASWILGSSSSMSTTSTETVAGAFLLFYVILHSFTKLNYKYIKIKLYLTDTLYIANNETY